MQEFTAVAAAFDFLLGYLDPGTGSMILQAIIAGFAAVGVAMAAFKHRLATFFRRVFKRRQTSLPEVEPSAKPSGNDARGD